MQQPIEGNDIIFPSSNEYGIPDLLLTHQCKSLDLPFTPHRSKATSRVRGTLHFYVDDVRFQGLWQKPYIFNQYLGKITALGELNYSNSIDTPLAVHIYQTFQKRWLSRYWQSHGFKILADLCVVPDRLDIATLGLPKGWASFATRIYTELLPWADEQWAKACEIAGHNQPLFVAYGGGKKARDYAFDKGWLWMADDSDRVRGRINGR